MSTMHEISSGGQAFHDIWHSRKTFEVLEDEGFLGGDVLHVTEDDGKRSVLALIVYVLRAGVSPKSGAEGLKPGYVVVALKLLTRLDGNLPCNMEGK